MSDRTIIPFSEYGPAYGSERPSRQPEPALVIMFPRVVVEPPTAVNPDPRKRPRRKKGGAT